MILLAAAFVLLFEYPMTYQPPPSHFLITTTQAGLTETLQVTRGDAARCAPWQGSGPTTVCATWPGCPPEGVMTLHVQAAWGAVVGAATEAIVCRFSAERPCECLPVEVAALIAPPVAPLPDRVPPQNAPVASAPSTAPTSLATVALAAVALPTWTMPIQPPGT